MLYEEVFCAKTVLHMGKTVSRSWKTIFNHRDWGVFSLYSVFELECILISCWCYKRALATSCTTFTTASSACELINGLLSTDSTTLKDKSSLFLLFFLVLPWQMLFLYWKKQDVVFSSWCLLTLGRHKFYPKERNKIVLLPTQSATARPHQSTWFIRSWAKNVSSFHFSIELRSTPFFGGTSAPSGVGRGSATPITATPLFSVLCIIGLALTWLVP